MTYFASLFSVSTTLGYFRFDASDCITLGAWLAVTETLAGDSVLLVPSCWGGWNMF